MLKKLIIEQFVIIDRLELDFQPGLTVLTGETGAGKSILLDAMGLILGDPSSPESIRHGAEQSVLSATFQPPPASAAQAYLDKHKLNPEGGAFTIYRTLKEDGADDIRIGDRPVELSMLKALGETLCEIHGQFANQTLLDPANQLRWVDLSGAFPPEVFSNVAEALRNVKRYAREVEEEKQFYSEHFKQLKHVETVVGRFEKLGMTEGGYTAHVEAEYTRLRTARDTQDAFQSITAQLIASNGAVNALSAANQALASQTTLDEAKIGKLKKFLADALQNARAAIGETRILAPEYDIDTTPLRHFEDTRAGLHKIADDADINYDQLEDYYAKVSTILNRVKNAKQAIKALEASLVAAKQDYRHHARILTDNRIVAGQALSEAITAGLPPLKLMNAQFAVLVEERPNSPWTNLGLDSVTFTARMNPGQPFSPIADTASGGEMARLILALKIVLQSIQTTPTLIFDEVDTGIGGAAAAAVGERIALLAENTQVLVITHSPQVASRGEQHLHVAKSTDGITTTSSVRSLPLQDRTNEISRMLAGDHLTTESTAAAERLLHEAAAARQKRKQPEAAEPSDA